MGHLLQESLKKLEIVCDSSGEKRVKIAELSDKTPNRICPTCKRPMGKLNYAYDSNVMVDKCQTCGCLFLDRGEIEKIAQYLKCSWKLLVNFREKSKKVDEIYRKAAREAVKENAKEKAKEVLTEATEKLVWYFILALLMG
jgi:Zn-finger nucleic acid-binding protein